MYLLDTNVISEIRKPKTRHPAVAAWFAEQWMGDLYLSVITIRELYYGASRLKDSNPELERELVTWIEGKVIASFGQFILPIDVGVARRHSMISLPNSNVSADSLIAATALQNELTVVTRNIADFERFGVKTFNPWTFQP